MTSPHGFVNDVEVDPFSDVSDETLVPSVNEFHFVPHESFQATRAKPWHSGSKRRDASTGSHWHCSQVIDVRSLCRMLPSTCQVEHVLHLHPQPPPGMMLKLIHSQMFQMKPWCLQ